MPSAATWMNLEIIKWSKSDKDKHHDTAYMRNLKDKTIQKKKNLFTNWNRHRLREGIYGYGGGQRGSED